MQDLPLFFLGAQHSDIKGQNTGAALFLIFGATAAERISVYTRTLRAQGQDSSGSAATIVIIFPLS